MKHARVAYGGAIHDAIAARAAACAWPTAACWPRTQVVWLPPFEAGTIIALGLNYADHAKELAKELTLSAKDEPLVFLKGPNALIGHRGSTRRPADATFMHYECELAVVIGRTRDERASAPTRWRHVAGYTVANDYAIRDYLENWYRPNLRVKNRDGCTVLGPWLVDAADVPDPHALALRTFVNGELTQQGNTRDLIYDIPALIEYLSSFMTLLPGDVILTGTPEGVVNVDARRRGGTEIDGIGRLRQHHRRRRRASAIKDRDHAHPPPDRRQGGRRAASASRPSTRPRRRCWPKWPRGGEAEVNAAVAAAKAAFPKWAAHARRRARAS